MEKIFTKIIEYLKKWIELSLYFLCFGVIVQLLIDDTILGWNPVGNIQDAGSSFIGVIAIILLYLLFVKKRS
jgi:hypothetical protein|tara:strand:+ start:744 stop:959 length:216 start_codon:yes stop_codon:yes gene_type:complete